MTVDEAVEHLRAGRHVRVTTGDDPEDPVLAVWLQDGVAMSEARAGWSAGVVEPVCEADSAYLREYLGQERVLELDDGTWGRK